MGWLIKNKDNTKAIFIYKDECSKMVIDKSILLTEVFNLPSNIFKNPKLYLGSEYNISKVDDEFIKDNLIHNYTDILFLGLNIAKYYDLLFYI